MVTYSNVISNLIVDPELNMITPTVLKCVDITV